MNNHIERQLLHCNIDGVFAFDHRCRYTAWNPAMEKVARTPADECLGRIAFEVFPFLVEIGEDKYFYQALDGNSVVSSDRPSSIPAANERMWFEAHYSPVKNLAGTIVGGLAIVRDVTQQHSMETEWYHAMADLRHRQKQIEKLSEQEQHIFDQMCDGVDRAQIAADLGVSLRTAARAKARIEKKLGVHRHNLHSFYRECTVHNAAPLLRVPRAS